MFYKNDDLNYEEKKLVNKMNDLLNWAKNNNRQDIVEEADKYGVINNKTNLKKAFSRLAQMKNQEKPVFSNTTQNIPTMQENNSPTPNANNQSEVVNNNPPPSDPSSFDPLLGANPKQRDYTSGLPQGNAGGSPGGNIPEPDFVGKGTSGFGQVPPNQPDNRFTDTKDLPPNEKARSSEQLAEVIVDAYGNYVPVAFTTMAKIKPSKVQELSLNGDIDLNMMVNGPEQSMTVGEYIEQSNAEIAKAFEVSAEWKQEVKPLLTRILAKRNWGMTDEQMLMYYVGSHLVQCTVVAIQINMSNKSFLQTLVNQTQAYRASGQMPPMPPSGNTPPPPPPPSAPTPPPPPTEPVIEVVEAEEIPNVDDGGLVEVTGMSVDPLSPARFSIPRNNRPSNMPPQDEMEDMPTASQMTPDNAGFNPII